MQPETFEIKLPQFEGPFDLLLFFIERDELDIQTIAIAAIADEFLEYIHQMNSLNIELASEFIIVAATLMRIKAKMLLPRYLADPENETDPQQDLIQRLLAYKKFKEVAEELKVLEDERLKMERRGAIADDLRMAGLLAVPGEELSAIDLYRLMLAYEKVTARSRNREEVVTHTVIQYPYSIEQQKSALSSLLKINKRLNFERIKEASENRIQFIYNFLAILEMLQQELVAIEVGSGYNNFWVTEM